MLVTRLFCASFFLAISTIPAVGGKIDTLSFTTLVYPNIPDPEAPNPGVVAFWGGNTVPTGINDAGTVTGTFPQVDGSSIVYGVPDFGFIENNGNYAAFFGNTPVILYVDQNGAIQTNGNFQNRAIYPAAINDSDQIAGSYVGDQYPDTYGFIGSTFEGASGLPQSLVVNPLSFPGLTFGLNVTTVAGMNDSGEIVGNFDDQLNSITGGYKLVNGTYTALPYSPLAINNLGQILGENASGDILIDTNGSIQNLGQLPFQPTGLNDSGVIVGGNYMDKNGVLTQIGLYGETSVQINAINDSDQFVGVAGGPGGQIGFEAVTPEPWLGVPLFAGIGGLVVARIRAQRRRLRTDKPQPCYDR